MKKLLLLSYFFSSYLGAWEYHAEKYLNDSSSYDQHPNGSLFHVTEPTTFTATLVGDSDVDLYLYSYKNGKWTSVEISNSDEWNEILMYQANDTDAWYAWFVVLKSPNTEGGNYTLDITD